MHVFLWSGTFLLFSIGGSAIELASLIGLPVAYDIHIGIAVLAVAVAISGAALVLLAPATPTREPTMALAA
jgi:hypothetical protein